MSSIPAIDQSDAGLRSVARQAPPRGLSGWQQGAVFLAACAILISRRPDAVFHAQFYAEDGHVWFANAYNLGWWKPLLHPQDGYFQTFPRLGAALCLLLPLALAPLGMNLLALAVQALPVNLLLSARSAVWGSLRFRAVLALMFLALPNCTEISLGITESQWLLALSAFLLLVAAPPGGAGKLFDAALLALSGLTGPFCLFLLPLAGWLALKRHRTWRWTPVWVVASCSLLQLCGLLLDGASRPHAALGATPALFTRIVGGNIFLAVALGQNGVAVDQGMGPLVVLACAFCAGSILTAACFRLAPLPMKLFLLLSCAILLASLVSPTTRPPAGYSVWEMLALAGGARYWFFPSLAFAWTLAWCAWSPNQALRAAVALILCAMCLSVPLGWRRPALKDMHFAEFARSFAAAPAGTAVVTAENPEGWTIRLIKRPR